MNGSAYEKIRQLTRWLGMFLVAAARMGRDIWLLALWSSSAQSVSFEWWIMHAGIQQPVQARRHELLKRSTCAVTVARGVHRCAAERAAARRFPRDSPSRTPSLQDIARAVRVQQLVEPLLQP
jgi:hypothetical protein